MAAISSGESARLKIPTSSMRPLKKGLVVSYEFLPMFKAEVEWTIEATSDVDPISCPFIYKLTAIPSYTPAT